MKIIVLLGVIVFILPCVELEEVDQAELDASSTNEDEDICILETSVSLLVVIKAKKTSTVPADDPNYKEFLSCCWKRYGYQREDNGEMEWDRIREVLGQTYKPSVAAKLVEKCNKIQGKTDGDTVALVLLCLDEHAPNIRSVHGYYAGHHRD